ncbi:ribonuclease H-like domain-containing protein [Tanacetum coccineum]|uniref:Ribonuclease H-like domain-containing protein n=1 Tax=Tanacetum coccineum TaxID=301880 RepID=A0ABQ5H1C7_9ASTR
MGSTSGIRVCALRNFDLEDYALWEVIENGNSWVPIPVTQSETGPSTALKMIVPSTSEEKMCKKNDVKARILLLMALPNDHQLTSDYLDDLYNNFKIVEQKVKKSAGASNDDKNLAFLTTSGASSTININTIKLEVSTATTKGSQLVHEDLEQLHDDDLEEMDLKWNMALLSMRARKFYQRTGRKIIINGSNTAGYDKSKVLIKAVKIEDAYEKAMCAIVCGFDWRDMAEMKFRPNMAIWILMFSEVTKNNAVPSPHPLILERPTPLDLFYSGLEEFKQPEVNEYGPRDSSLKPTTGCDKESDNSKENTDDSLKQQQKTDSKTSSVKSPLKVDKDWKEKFFCPANQVREEEPKKARENNDAPIIEDWVSDDEDEVEPIPKVEKKTVIPTATKKEFVKPEKPVRRSVRYAEMYRSQRPRGNQRNWNGQKSNQLGCNFVFNNKACFICGSFDHIQYSCPKHMAPRAVLMKTGLKTVNTARPVNTVRSVNTGRPFSTARSFNTVRPSYTAHPKSTVHYARPRTHFQNQAQSTVHRPFYKRTALTNKSFNHRLNTGRPFKSTVNTVRARGFNVVKPSACWVWRPIKPNGASLSNSQLNDKGFVDSGCSRHMTGNIAHLSDFKDFDGGYVTFGGGAYGGRITGKGTIKTDNLDFDDVYFVKELKFNLFSVSQMCDKKNYVLFTDSECLVLSPNFKLPDENQILLKIPRHDNMYSFDMKNIVPKDSLSCLVAKAISKESMLWHRRLGYVNFKNINKLVKENLVRDLPLKRFENDQTCVACLKGKQHIASCKTKAFNPDLCDLMCLYLCLRVVYLLGINLHEELILPRTNVNFFKELPADGITHVKKSAGASNDDKNLAFLTTSGASSTININTIKLEVSTATTKAIHDDDLEECDLKGKLKKKIWALLSMRARKFYQRTGRKIIINGSNTAGYDKSKVECFNCHKIGHFFQRMQSTKSKDNRNWNPDSEVTNDKSCSKSCLKNYEALKKQYDDLLVKLDDTGFKASTYKRGLSILEGQVVKYKEHEVFFSEEIALLKRSVGHKEYQIGLLRTGLEKVKLEKEGNSSLKPTTGCDKESDNSKENTDDSLKQQQMTDTQTSSVKSSLQVDKDWKEKFFYPANHVRVVEPEKARENNDAPIN